MALSAVDYWDKIDADSVTALKTAQEEYATNGIGPSMDQVLGFLMYVPVEDCLLLVVSCLKLLAYRSYLETASRLRSRSEVENLLGEGMGN